MKKHPKMGTMMTGGWFYGIVLPTVPGYSPMITSNQCELMVLYIYIHTTCIKQNLLGEIWFNPKFEIEVITLW